MVSILTAYHDLQRLRQITGILVKHGFGEIVGRLGLSRVRPGEPDLEGSDEEKQAGAEEAKREDFAVRLRLAATDLGPSFVKLAQIVSTRTDVVPPEIVRELKKLQDAVPAVPFEDVRQQVEEQLGKPLDEVYEWFDEKPLAAASIGQVHRARLRTEEGIKEVVVKVQRPGVGVTIARDLDLLALLAQLLERAVPESKVYSPVGMVENFARSITAELDYTIEADNARRFDKNFQNDPQVRFPRVYREGSTRHVLTLEFFSGKKIYDAIRDDGHSGELISKLTTRIVFQQIFQDGFFHADPHPGNVLVFGQPDKPILGLIDLGMVGRMSVELRDKTVDLMLAAVRADALAVADALYAIGTPTRKVDLRAYRAEASMLAEKYLGKQLKEIELSKMIGDLVMGASKYGIEIPPDFLMVGKALMTLEGVGKEIYPELDVFEETKPFFLELLRERYSPERMLNEVWRIAERLSGAAYDVPQQLREVLEDLRLGRLTIKTSTADGAAITDRLGRRLFSGMVISATALAGAWLLASPPDGVRERLGVVLIVLAALVLVAHVARDLRR